jgi:hypothetical protein
MKSTAQLIDVVKQAKAVLTRAHRYKADQRLWHATQLTDVILYLEVIKKTKRGNIRPK